VASRRCSSCGISYPTDQRFYKCPVHGEPTAYFQNVEPDENWQWAATAIQMQLERAAADVSPITILDLTPEPIPGGLYTLNAHDVIRAGAQLRGEEVFVIEPPEAPKTGEPCDCFWEVVGYHDGTRQWIVQPVRVPDYVPAP
jgi:hypothetical protein